MSNIHSLVGDVKCDARIARAEAIEALNLALECQAPYHLVTVDIRLGDMEGQQLVTHIRTWERRQNLVSQDLECQILMVTAMSDSAIYSPLLNRAVNNT